MAALTTAGPPPPQKNAFPLPFADARPCSNLCVHRLQHCWRPSTRPAAGRARRLRRPTGGGILAMGWLQGTRQPRIPSAKRGKEGKPADCTDKSSEGLPAVSPAGIVGAAMPQLALSRASRPLAFAPAQKGHMASLFYAERLLGISRLGVLGAAVGWPRRAAPRGNARASEGLSRSSRFHEIPSFSLFPTPKARNRLIPRRLRSASRTARNDTKAIPGAACKSLGMVKGWRLRMENPFSKEGSPPTVPSPLPQVPCRPPLPTPSRTKSSGRLLLSLGLTCLRRAGLAAISLPLVAVVLGHGAFDAQAVSATALALCAYAPGLPAYALSRPLLAACHALESGAPAQGRRRCSGRPPLQGGLRPHPAFRGMGAAARRLRGALVQCGPALDRTLPRVFPAGFRSAPSPCSLPERP